MGDNVFSENVTPAQVYSCIAKQQFPGRVDATMEVMKENLDWNTWRVERWNKELVDAVFLDAERILLPVKRISISERFLVGCTSDLGANGKAVRMAFISSFGQTDAEIRKHFNRSRKSSTAVGGDQLPSFFASLYLTLLAGGADEATHDEGNFRARFAEMLAPATIAPSDLFVDLASMWKDLRDWSAARAEKWRDCRVLHLPDPRHERRIGYSKRLAFPGYRDETRLQHLLQKFCVGVESGFERVAQLIAAHESGFSDAFAEESRHFRNSVARARPREAYESPFWDAVREITWESRIQAATTTGAFCFGIDIGNPYKPLLYVLANESGRQALGVTWQSRASLPGSDYPHMMSPADGANLTPDFLARVTSNTARLRAHAIWRAIDSGCVLFLLDGRGDLTTGGSHDDGDAVCILVKSRTVAEVEKQADYIGLKAFTPRGGATLGSWKVLAYPASSIASFDRLARILPSEALAAAHLSWRPPRITLSKAAWYGQSLLLSPASNPVVRMPGAVEGRLELLDGAGKLLTSLLLANIAEDYFQTPVASLVDLGAAEKARFLLVCNKQITHATYPLATNVPFLTPQFQSFSDGRLATGPAGRLCDARVALGIEARLDAVQFPGDLRSKRLPWLVEGDSESWAPSGRQSVNSLPRFMSWQSDALSLRFQTRASLPFSDFKGHVEGAARADGIPFWQASRLLACSGWVATVQRQGTPFSLIIQSPRTIARCGGKDATVRIVGMLASSERTRMLSMLRPGEEAFMPRAGTAALGIGAIELTLQDGGRAQEFARDFNCIWISDYEKATPIDAAENFPSWKGITGRELPELAEVVVWDDKSYGWIPRNPDQRPVAGTLAWIKSNSHATYVVFDSDSAIQTDSRDWAWLYRLVAMELPLGTLATNGDCRFHKSIMALPISFCRWWLHHGGGAISIGADGSIIFGAGSGRHAWDLLPAWLLPRRPDPVTPLRVDTDVALTRRAHALRNVFPARPSRPAIIRAAASRFDNNYDK